MVVLPDGGSGVAAISFMGALKIPVSARVWGACQRGRSCGLEETGRLIIKLQEGSPELHNPSIRKSQHEQKLQPDQLRTEHGRGVLFAS